MTKGGCCLLNISVNFLNIFISGQIEMCKPYQLEFSDRRRALLRVCGVWAYHDV